MVFNRCSRQTCSIGNTRATLWATVTARTQLLPDQTCQAQATENQCEGPKSRCDPCKTETDHHRNGKERSDAEIPPSEGSVMFSRCHSAYYYAEPLIIVSF